MFAMILMGAVRLVAFAIPFILVWMVARLLWRLGLK
jgi:hypothetical protein